MDPARFQHLPSARSEARYPVFVAPVVSLALFFALALVQPDVTLGAGWTAANATPPLNAPPARVTSPPRAFTRPPPPPPLASWERDRLVTPRESWAIQLGLALAVEAAMTGFALTWTVGTDQIDAGTIEQLVPPRTQYDALAPR